MSQKGNFKFIDTQFSSGFIRSIPEIYSQRRCQNVEIVARGPAGCRSFSWCAHKRGQAKGDDCATERSLCCFVSCVCRTGLFETSVLRTT